MLNCGSVKLGFVAWDYKVVAQTLTPQFNDIKYPQN